MPAKKTTHKRSSSPRRKVPVKKQRPRKTVTVIAILCGGALLGLGVLIGFLDGYGLHDGGRVKNFHADAIVVLGAKVMPGGVAGKGLQMRTLQAAKLYKNKRAAKLICTGGVGENPPAEAHVASLLAQKYGVPQSAIIEEDKSTSTWENAANTAAICKKHGWKRLIIVSDPFHLWRAEHNFSKNDLIAVGSPVSPQQWQAQPLKRIFWTAREAILVTRDWALRRV